MAVSSLVGEGERIGFGGVATDCRAIGAVVERKKKLGT